jgi:cytochrome c oxidase cbb3-type subunit 1
MTPGCRMTATSPTSPSPVDASCRLPLLALFGGAALWLVLSAAFGLIASIKFHSPNFLADCAWLTYGRVRPAGLNLLVFGFAIPAGLGVMLWLLARLGRVPLVRPAVGLIGAKLWHLGVLVGLLGILRVGPTGFEWLEMPRAAAIILFVAFLLIALMGFLTYQARRAAALYPSQWFVLAALLWFPWIYSTANLLLLVFPVRGVVQASVAWWFAGNLLVVWLSLAGLAATFYLLPKLSGRPLQSHYLALFVFWTVILFGTWVGIPGGAALPAWMPALSSAAAVLTLVPALAVATGAWLTLRGPKPEGAADTPALWFVKFGIFALGLSGLMLAVSALPPLRRVTEFTWFGPAQTLLRVFGFFGMTLFGAAYHVLPRVAGRDLPFPRLVRLHFWCGVLGTLLLPLPLAIGGVAQGLKLMQANVAFDESTRSALILLRVSTVGDLLLVLGSLLFLLNVGVLIGRQGRALCARMLAAATAPVESKMASARAAGGEVAR